MDTGTIIRTVLAIATALNTALMATDLTGFDNPSLNSAYKVASIILNFIIVALVTYYNNDFTDAGSVGTTITRQLKSDPTLVAEVYDPDADDDDSWAQEDADPDEEGDEIIEEGEADEVEQE